MNAFDDLVPPPASGSASTPPPQAANAFDDLIPTQKVAAPPMDASVRAMTPSEERSPLGRPMPSAASLAAAGYGQVAPAAHEQQHTYSVLPISEDASGKPHFDSNAGIVGAIKSAITLPGDVYAGRVDPKSEEGIQRSFGLATLAGPVNAIGATKTVAGKVAAPTAEALREAAGNGYDLARGLGVDYSSKAVQDMTAGLRNNLEQNGIIKELAPKTFSIIDKLGNPPEGSVAPLSGLEAARRTFGNAGRDFGNPTEQLAAGIAKDHLDNFMVQPPAGGVVAGPADKAAQAIHEARGNYAAAKRSEQLTDSMGNAELTTDASNSGLNLENNIRRSAAKILKSDKLKAGFNDDELAALQKVVEPGASREILRHVGNLLGGGGGLGSIIAGGAGLVAGAGVAGPFGALIAPAAGFGMRKISNELARRSMHGVDELVRSRSPLNAKALDDALRAASLPGRNVAAQRAALAAALSGQIEDQPR